MIFRSIGVISFTKTKIDQDNNKKLQHTVKLLIDFLLINNNIKIYLDKNLAQAQSVNNNTHITDLSLSKNLKKLDLLVTIGGDGSLLAAARLAIPVNLPVLGINLGYLGFLTDITPDHINLLLSQILAGHYLIEQRLILEIYLDHKNIGFALNEVVFSSYPVAELFNFEILINNQFLCSQRADGLIIATPTGSTAYALSAGGPILHPTLKAIVLVPMFSHTLTQRPIVLNQESKIQLRLLSNNSDVMVRFDGQQPVLIDAETSVNILPAAQSLHLIHPKSYNFFENLREKLHWGKSLK